MSDLERRRHRYIPVLQPRLYDPFADEEMDEEAAESRAEVQPDREKSLSEKEILQEFEALALINRIKNFRELVDPHTNDWTVTFLISPERSVIFQKGMSKPSEVAVQPKFVKSAPEVKTYSGEIAVKISEIWFNLHPKPNE